MVTKVNENKICKIPYMSTLIAEAIKGMTPRVTQSKQAAEKSKKFRQVFKQLLK